MTDKKRYNQGINRCMFYVTHLFIYELLYTCYNTILRVKCNALINRQIKFVNKTALILLNNKNDIIKKINE